MSQSQALQTSLNICSLSTIIICRFHLDLQEKNAHPNNSRDLSTIAIGSFRAANQQIHDAVMEEFGGSLGDESVEGEAAMDGIELEVSVPATES